jgi:hypothetical protein
MERPVGVTILAILALIGGVFSLFGALIVLGLGGAVTIGGAATGHAGAAVGGGLIFVMGILVAVSGLLSLAFGVGALQLKPWAWTLGIVAEGLSILTSLMGLSRSDNRGGSVFGILVAVAILYYLFTPRVRAAFGK